LTCTPHAARVPSAAHSDRTSTTSVRQPFLHAAPKREAPGAFANKWRVLVLVSLGGFRSSQSLLRQPVPVYPAGLTRPSPAAPRHDRPRAPTIKVVFLFRARCVSRRALRLRYSASGRCECFVSACSSALGSRFSLLHKNAASPPRPLHLYGSTAAQAKAWCFLVHADASLPLLRGAGVKVVASFTRTHLYLSLSSLTTSLLSPLLALQRQEAPVGVQIVGQGSRLTWFQGVGDTSRGLIQTSHLRGQHLRDNC
jgi:hypothetical protein